MLLVRAISPELRILAAWELKHFPGWPGQEGQVWLVCHVVVGNPLDLSRPASVPLAESERDNIDSIVGGRETWGPFFLL